jgi:hypothetical protein
MKETDCVKKGGEIKDCLKTDTQCYEYRTAYFECKRGSLDMTARIRGQKGFE